MMQSAESLGATKASPRPTHTHGDIFSHAGYTSRWSAYLFPFDEPLSRQRAARVIQEKADWALKIAKPPVRELRSALVASHAGQVYVQLFARCPIQSA